LIECGSGFLPHQQRQQVLLGGEQIGCVLCCCHLKGQGIQQQIPQVLIACFGSGEGC